MSNAAPRSAPALPFEPPDPQFRLVVGLYVALLVVPLVLFGAVTVGFSDAAALYGVFLIAGLLLVAVVTWALGRLDGAAVRLGNSRLRWFLASSARSHRRFVHHPLTYRRDRDVGFFLGLFAASQDCCWR
ncbi:hypothetical protein GBQ70_12045 [Halomicrobium sp. ZPS1]|nr:hypothetical protein GBQ70_12045 [Halomicrobium sp. ZPS1]